MMLIYQLGFILTFGPETSEGDLKLALSLVQSLRGVGAAAADQAKPKPGVGWCIVGTIRPGERNPPLHAPFLKPVLEALGMTQVEWVDNDHVVGSAVGQRELKIATDLLADQLGVPHLLSSLGDERDDDDLPVSIGQPRAWLLEETARARLRAAVRRIAVNDRSAVVLD